MDYVQLLALVGALASPPDGAAVSRPFASNVSISACPRPLPVYDVEGKTIVCGTVTVPEDRTKPDGRKIALAFAVLKAETRFAEPDPLVYLEGGPGGSAVRTLTMLRPAVQAMARAPRHRDLRPALGGHFRRIRQLRAGAVGQRPRRDRTPGSKAKCRRHSRRRVVQGMRRRTRKQQGVPLALYNTTENALDVPLVDEGARLCRLQHLRHLLRHQARAGGDARGAAGCPLRHHRRRRPALGEPLQFPRQKIDEAIQHVVDQCAADKTCNDAYPDLGRIFIETLEQGRQGRDPVPAAKAIGRSRRLRRSSRATAITISRPSPASFRPISMNSGAARRCRRSRC